MLPNSEMSETTDNPGRTSGARAQHHMDMAFKIGVELLLKHMSDASADGMVSRESRTNAMKCLRTLVILAPFLDHEGDIEELMDAMERWKLPRRTG